MVSTILWRRFAVSIGIGLAVGWLGNFFLQPAKTLISESATTAEDGGVNRRLTLSHLFENEKTSTLTWAKAIPNASGLEIRDFLEQWERVGGPEARKALRTLAFKRWFSIDPEAAWEYAHTRALREEEDSWITEALAVWSERDARAAFQAVGNGTIPQRWRRTAEGAIVSQLGAADPEKMLALAREFGSRMTKPIYSRLTKIDPELAAKEAFENPSERALGGVLVEWVRQGGGSEAFRWMQEHASKDSANLHLLGVVWGTLEPEAAAPHLDAFAPSRSGLSRDSMIGKIAGAWWRFDPEATQTWLDEVTTEGAGAEAVQQAMISGVAVTDPEAALALHREAVAAGFSPTLSSLPAKWKSRQPDTIDAWVENLPDDRSRSSALTRVLKHRFEQDPIGMLEALPELLVAMPGESSDYTALANSVLNSLSSRGQEATESWIASLPEHHRAGFAARYASTLSDRDPEAALEFLTNRPTQDGVSSPSFQRIIAAWARQDPAKAAERALAEPDLQLRELAVTNVANVWKVTDPESAQHLLDSIE